MKDPVAHLRDVLGPLGSVVILGVTVDLAAEVALPPRTEDMEDALYDNVERVMKWGRIVAECERVVARELSKVKELEGHYFVGYWERLEEVERAEMKAHLHDEDELDKDAQDAAAGEQGFQLRRRRRTAARVTSGPAAGRWRRNFSDELVRHHLKNDPVIITAYKTLRLAQHQLNLAKSVSETIDHRSRAISHLCAMHRDNTRH